MSDCITEIFASNVFSRTVMQERLPKKVYAELVDVMDNGGNISMATADIVATAMKDWAVEKGATHYAHWFQPLTGITALRSTTPSSRRRRTAEPCFSSPASS